MRTHVGAHAVRVVVSLLIAGAPVGVSGEVAAADQTGAAVPAVSFSARGGLIDVAAASARNAWAVGRAGSIDALTGEQQRALAQISEAITARADAPTP